MQGTRLTPEKITSPFQLMAAWFAMLILLVSTLLTAACTISKPDWAAGFLVLFAACVVVGVIACVTLMLTKFRPHLQDGKEYAQWLKDQNAYSAVYLQKPTPVRRPAKETGTVAIARSKRVVRGKNFLTSVIGATGGLDLVEALKGAGFTAEIYDEPLSDESSLNDIAQHEGIWVGARLAPSAVVEAIKIAVAKWPTLKYVHLSTDDGGGPPDYVHEELFLGGATETAHRFGLLAWSSEEVQALDEKMTLKQFHAAVRAKYA